MDKKLITNYIYNILYQIVKIALPVVIVPYTMGHLGADALGYSDFAGSIATWFILFGVLGIDVYGNRECAKVRDNKEELSKTFSQLLVVRIINMAIAAILFIGYINLFVSGDKDIYYLYLIMILASTFDITWFFYSVEHFKAVSLRNIAVKIIGVAFIFLLVKKPEDLWLFVLINGLSEVFGSTIMFVQLKSHINFKIVGIKESYKAHLKGSFALFLPSLAISIYTILDQTMIGFLSDDISNVALYKSSQGFVKMFLYFITSIGAVMLPRITNVYHKDNKSEEIGKYLNTTSKIAMLLAIPMMMGMIGVSPYFIPWYLPEQPLISTLIQVSSPVIIFISLSNVFGIQYLVPTGKTKLYTKTVVYGAIVNFFANLFLIPSFGAIGAAIGSVIAELTVVSIQYFYFRKEVKLVFGLSVIKYFVAAALMLVGVIYIGEIFGVSLLTNMIQVAVGVSIYGIMLIILKDEFTLSIIKKVLRRA